MAHPGATVEEVCERFKITREDLAGDLDLLVVCGLPPFGPGDMIEAWIDGDHIHLAAADYLSRPLRLTRFEAVSLLVMGRALASLPGLAEGDSLHRALAKIERALSPEESAAAADLAARVAVDLEGTGAEPLLADLRDAIADRKRLRVTYYSFGRDRITDRAIDPYVVFSTLGNWYVLAHDSASGEERIFRVDRIKDLAATGETFTVPDDVDPERAAAGGLFVPSARDIVVTLEVAPEAGWVLEVTPHDRTESLKDGWTSGSAVRIVAPDHLVDGVRSAAARALAAYRA
jgi:proteasome accessory factor C